VARTELAARLLGWVPKVALDDGLRAQVRWHEARRDRARTTVAAAREH
jgi:nucleoside-diphosphate-sugar epimerase